MKDKYVKIKELKDLPKTNISSIQELNKDKFYLIGVEVGNIPKEMVPKMLENLTRVLGAAGVKTLIHPIRDGIGKLTIYEMENPE